MRNLFVDGVGTSLTLLARRSGCAKVAEPTAQKECASGSTYSAANTHLDRDAQINRCR